MIPNNATGGSLGQSRPENHVGVATNSGHKKGGLWEKPALKEVVVV